MRVIIARRPAAGSVVAVLLAWCFSYSINSLSDRRATVTPSLETEAALAASSARICEGVLMLAYLRHGARL